MNTIRTLSTTRHSSLQGPIFSSTLLRPTEEEKSRSYPVRGIGAAILLAGASAVSALPIFAPSAVTGAATGDEVPEEVAALISEMPDDTSSQVIDSVVHPPAAIADNDPLSLGSDYAVDLLSASDDEAPDAATPVLTIEEIAPATDVGGSAGGSSDQSSGQTRDNQPSGAPAPGDTSGDGESEAGGGDGGEGAYGGGESAGGNEGTGDEAAGSDGDDASDAPGDDAGNGGDGQGEGSGNGQGNGPSDSSQGNGPPQDTPGNAPSGDNPGNGSPQGSPGGNGNGNGGGNGNGNGQK